MSLFLQMKNIKSRVELLLRKTPHLRDDDFKLIATYWWHEVGKEKCEMMTGHDFLSLFSRGVLTSEKSIVRVRAKLQEEHPELRGASYRSRARQSEEIRNGINTEL